MRLFPRSFKSLLRKNLLGKGPSGKRLWGRRSRPVVAVIRLQGIIGAPGGVRPALNLAGLSPVLEKAFRAKSAAVALVINSPGGSPVQAHLVFQRIRDLAGRHKRRVLVFVEDVAASGGYMLALAGDEIHADPSSVIGSIGVVSAGFGFPELLKKWGIERRVYTSGGRKAILDPFRAENDSDVAHLKELQSEIHAWFRALVEERRGAHLAADEALFSGLFWTGKKAHALGLVDGIGQLHPVLRARYGENVRLRLFGAPRTLFSRRAGIRAAWQGPLCADLPEAALGALEERSIWARYGL